MNHSEAVRSSAAERYLLDEMSEPERYAFEAHYFDCVECAEDLRAAAAMRDGVRNGILRPGAVVPIAAAKNRSARQGASRWRPAAILPWAAAATLALVVGYQSVGPGRDAGRLRTEALSPVTLRPESRGAVPVVPLAAGRSVVTLAVDVATSGDPELTFELRTGADETVDSGRVAAPPPGTPLLLMLPAWTLNPSEHYILSVRRATDRQLLGEYRFAVAGQ